VPDEQPGRDEKTASDEQPTLGVETEPRVIEPEVRPPSTSSLGAWWLVVAAGCVGLALLALDQLRWSMTALAVSLWVGAVLRALTSRERAGGLVVRSRAFDVAALVLLGGAVLLVGLNLRRT
jgi:hypothetical protein